MTVKGHHTVDQAETCATEIAGFLSNLSNWEQPFFPEVPDCVSLEVEPSYFNTSGTFWSCGDQIKEGESQDYVLHNDSVKCNVINTQI